ncbi:MAG: hypothetical protein V4642_12590 [Bacteroidota bacterium]
MNVHEKLIHEKERLLKQKEAAQSLCNTPMAAQYQILLDGIDKKIAEITKRK